MALQKNKREICKDKQILKISRFYKTAFVMIIIFFGHVINEKEEKMQEKICLTFWKSGNIIIAMKKCVAYQRKSNLLMRWGCTFFMQK